jgi:iron complex transport system ATP-binding protein
MTGELYIAEGLEFSWKPKIPVLEGVNFKVEPGEFVALIGPNGAGKSTLLKLLVGLIKPRAGTIRFGGRDLGSFNPRTLARRVAYLPQEDEVHFPFTVGEIVMLGRWPHSGGAFFDNPSDIEAASKAMNMVGISDWAGRRVTELSGGERARVMLARAIAAEPDCFLLDEPASELDLRYRAESYGLLRKLADAGRGIVVAAHDVGTVARWADRLTLLADGRVVADGSGERVLDPALLEAAYGTKVKVISDGLDWAVFASSGGERGK